MIVFVRQLKYLKERYCSNALPYTHQSLASARKTRSHSLLMNLPSTTDHGPWNYFKGICNRRWASLIDWCDLLKINTNPNKFFYMIIKNSKKLLEDFQIKWVSVNWAQALKFLGVTHTPRLKWNGHHKNESKQQTWKSWVSPAEAE